ncbi:MAG TPA: hypothetical protein VFS55_02025 [Dokdonella sp.]|nr:hypothetical protein [Dokdonella sp.]
MNDRHLQTPEERLDIGPARHEPAALASAVLHCMSDRPLALYVDQACSLKCVPAHALGEMLDEIEVDDIVGVYSPKAACDAIADDIRAYVEARFGAPRLAPASGPRPAA